MPRSSYPSNVYTRIDKELKRAKKLAEGHVVEVERISHAERCLSEAYNLLKLRYSLLEQSKLHIDNGEQQAPSAPEPPPDNIQPEPAQSPEQIYNAALDLFRDFLLTKDKSKEIECNRLYASLPPEHRQKLIAEVREIARIQKEIDNFDGVPEES